MLHYREMISIDVGRGAIAFIDADDFPHVGRYTWRVRDDGYVQRTWMSQYTMRHELLHRFVMNAGPGELVDHRNGDRWDCRKENLRVATLSQNAANRASLAGRTWKGIFQHGETWKARIKVDQQSIYLGCFSTPEEAALAYDIAAKKLFGEFACVNFSTR